MRESQVQYVSDAEGKNVGVIVPIDLWRDIESELETAHLLGSSAMRLRLVEAMNREGGMSLEEATHRLGV